jgi:hypothetical protein
MSEKLSIEEINRRFAQSQAASWKRRGYDNSPATFRDLWPWYLALVAIALLSIAAVVAWA